MREQDSARSNLIFVGAVATQVEALQFQVFTNAAAPTPFDFCVDAIRVVTDGAPLAAAAGSGGGG